MKRVLFVAALVVSSSAMAINFDVSIDCTAFWGSSPNSVQQTTCDSLESELESQAEGDLPEADLGDYTVGVGNSVAMAGSDNSDYSDDFDLFMIKYAPLGLGFSGTDSSDINSLDGFGFQGIMQVGVNLDLLPVDKIGPIEFEKLDIFGSFFSMNRKDENSSEGSETDAEVSAMGIHVRYHIVEGVDLLPGYMAQWGGVYLHTGFRQSKMKLNYTKEIKDQDVSSDGVSAELRDGVAEFDMDSSVTSIPIEASTYFRFLYVFTLYGGAGYTFNTGSTDIDFVASGDIYRTDSNVGDVGDVDLDDKNNGAVESTARYFAGLQVNLPYFRLYTQLNKAMGSEVAAVNVGVKILY